MGGSLTVKHLVDRIGVHVLLSGLYSPEDVALDDGDLVPVVENLRIVHLNLAL